MHLDLPSFRSSRAVVVFAVALALSAGCEGTIEDSDALPAAGAGVSGTFAGTGGAGAGGVGGAGTGGTGGTGGAPALDASTSAGTGGSTGDGGSALDGAVVDAAPDASDPNAPPPSAGCGLPAGQGEASWVEQPRLSVRSKDRQWWVWLPEGYDPTRVYPVVFTFHGCGGPTNFIPLQEATGADAIVVRGTGETDSCWTYGAQGEDVDFFDAMLAEVLATRCADAERVFVAGFSSGGWLVNTLGCVRGDKIRAGGSVAGGVAISTDDCAAPYARIFIHDEDDDTNPFEGQGTKDELERLVAANHCEAPAVLEDPEPCARYPGCDEGRPVVLCHTSGEGHSRQDDLAKAAFWKFFSSL